jgi:hypothetical protein
MQLQISCNLSFATRRISSCIRQLQNAKILVVYVILCLLLQFWYLILVAWYVIFCFLVCNFVFVYSLVCVILCFFVAISCVNLFFLTIQSSKCHVFAAVVYYFLTDSLKIFRNLFFGCFLTDGLFC